MYDEIVVEVIKDGQIMRVPKSQAEEEELFILNTPSKQEIYAQANVPMPAKKNHLTLDLTPKDKAAKDSLRQRIANSLEDNFHWKLSRMRREKGISRMQLAKTIGDSEDNIKRLELGELDSNSIVLITKLEEALGISLRKDKDAFNSARKMLEENQAEKFREERRNESKKKIEKADADAWVGGDIEIID